MHEEFVDAFYLLLGLAAALTVMLCVAKAGVEILLWAKAVSHKPRHRRWVTHPASMGGHL